MKKEGVKYRVDLGLKWVNDKIVMPQLKEEKLKEEIDSMMPEGFSFKEGFFSSEKPSHGIWEQKKMFGRNTICCEIVRGHQDYRTPDGMATWYWTYHISIWSTTGKFFGIRLENNEKLDAICQNIAEFIEKKYEIKVMTREELKAMPERSEFLDSESGISVKKGEFSCWCDTSELPITLPSLLREKLGMDFEIEKIIGYQYSIGYIIEDWDLPIENYYCEKEEYWSGSTHEKTEEMNELEDLEDLSKWDKELIGRFCSKYRGYFEDFYKADNGQWPSLCWAYLYVYIVSRNNLKTIKFQEKDREAVVYGAFEELRSWLEKRFKSCARHG